MRTHPNRRRREWLALLACALVPLACGYDMSPEEALAADAGDTLLADGGQPPDSTLDAGSQEDGGTPDTDGGTGTTPGTDGGWSTPGSDGGTAGPPGSDGGTPRPNP